MNLNILGTIELSLPLSPTYIKYLLLDGLKKHEKLPSLLHFAPQGLHQITNYSKQ